jgi:hypothetical protein
MKQDDYFNLFEELLQESSIEPYSKEDIRITTQANHEIVNKILQNEWSEEVKQMIPVHVHPQKWILIAEHWCADSANIVPYISKLAKAIPTVDLSIELRDSKPFTINQFLTNGGKAIPKLIAKDEKGDVLFTWGPRPDKLTQLVRKWKEEKLENSIFKQNIQNWYDEDQGNETIIELINLIK